MMFSVIIVIYYIIITLYKSKLSVGSNLFSEFIMCSLPVAAFGFEIE